MGNTSSYDFTPGKRVLVESVAPIEGHVWQEEAKASPDCGKMAAVVKVDDFDYRVRVNDQVWENAFEKIWELTFTPDNKAACIAMLDGEWTIAIDGEPWEGTHTYLMNMLCTEGAVACAVQQDMKYGMINNGKIWDNLFENANNFALSPDGSKTAAAVQIKQLAQADIDTFQEGIFSVAVDGNVWDMTAVNTFSPVFSADSSSVACQARLNLYDYSIAVDGKLWDGRYQCVWEPLFNPKTKELCAPVRVAGKWGVAKDDAMLWAPEFIQCWHLAFSADGSTLAAIVAKDFGQFSVAVNNKAWSSSFPVVTDLVVSPDGSRAAALGNKLNTDWQLMVDDKVLSDKFEMMYKPVFSPDSSQVAVRADKGGKFSLLVNGKAYNETFDQLWDPVFSPDSSTVLFCGIQNGQFVQVACPVKDI